MKVNEMAAEAQGFAAIRDAYQLYEWGVEITFNAGVRTA